MLSTNASPHLPPGWTASELARFQTYMANTEPLWQPDYGLTWDEGELTQVEEFANAQAQASQGTKAPGIGHNAPPQHQHPDPLADLSPWQIYVDCIWISDEDTYVKIMLLCIARYMSKQLRGGSSMSYSQVAHDCGFSEPTAKRVGKKLRGVGDKSRRRWLRVEVGKGRYVPGKGSENLYHGVIPPDLQNQLREIIIIRRRKSGVSDGYPVEGGEVSEGYPEPDCGVSDRHPEGERGIPQTQAGYPTDTLTPHTPHRKKDLPPGGGAASKRIAPTQAEIDATFAEWWAQYPRKDAKLAAKKAYVAIVAGKHRDPEARATPQQLLAAVKAYKFPSDPRFIKHPATWLNDGSWADFVAAASVSTPNGHCALQLQFIDMSGDLVGCRRFLAHAGVKPGKPWPAGIGPQSYYHPQALSELGFSSTRGSS
jgi:hypothetical protein